MKNYRRFMLLALCLLANVKQSEERFKDPATSYSNNGDCGPGACHNNGTCIDTIGGFECRCPPGFVGNRCEDDIECLSNPCSTAGTLYCVQLVDDFHCTCKSWFIGRHCEIYVNFCANFPCLNGGYCSVTLNGYHCLCPEGFYGEECEFSGHDCDSNPCNAGDCQSIDSGGYICNCPYGTSGRYCEIGSVDECMSSPCKQNGRCISKLGDFECVCPSRWQGKTCDIYNKNFSKDLFGSDHDYQQCQEGCQAKQGNGKCDDECNFLECDFDGNDCSLGEKPWRNCTAIIDCWKVFADGVCNEECNTPECLFDGRDCEKTLEPCGGGQFDFYCLTHYANGVCDYSCNNANCNWDGLDCDEKEAENLAEGFISIILLMEMKEFKSLTVKFLRDVGHELRTTVRIKKDSFGNEMIHSWKGSSSSNLSVLEGSELAEVRRFGQSGVHVHLEIDNRKCAGDPGSKCFSSASEAAQYLAATAVKHNLSLNYPIESLRGVDNPGTAVDPTNRNWVISGIFLVFLLCFLAAVLVSYKRHRSNGVTWHSERLFTSGGSGPRQQAVARRCGPDQKMRGINKLSDMNGPASHSQQWFDEESEMPRSKRMRGLDLENASDHTIDTDYEEADAGVWSHQHLETADIRVPKAMMIPPEQHNGNIEIDIRGPCGMTPLIAT